MISASPPSSLLRHHHHDFFPLLRQSSTRIRQNISALNSSSTLFPQEWHRIGGQLVHQRMAIASVGSDAGFYGRRKKRMDLCIKASSVGDGEVKTSKLMTLPTILTLGRVVAVPFLVGTFYIDTWWSATATTSIFIIAAVTDWLDGYLARKMHLGTPFGAFLDPVADKLMVAATLILLCTKPLESLIFRQTPWILAVPSIAIIGREITMSALREWAASQDSKVLEAVAVNNLGKWKTATQMAALTILLAIRDPSCRGLEGFGAMGVILLYLSAVLAAWSLSVYMKNIWRILNVSVKESKKKM